MRRSAITAVIVNYRTPDLAKRCLDALLAEPDELFSLDAVLVDGHSEDGSVEELQRYCDHHPTRAIQFLALEQNGGFGWANNQALLQLLARDDPPEFIYLLNPDAVVQAHALARLVAHMRRQSDCAAVGSLLLNEDGMRLGSAFRFPSLRSEFARASRIAKLGDWLGVGDGLVNSDHAVECDWATGASFLMRSEALRQAGVFDDGFFLYFEDIELMWRQRKRGWTVWHEPASRVIHVGGAATGLNSIPSVGRKAPRRPAYWYKARRRYFALTRGRTIAILSTLAWLAGSGLGEIRKLLRLGEVRQDVTGELGDMLRHGLIVPSSAGQPSIPHDVSQIGRSPAWQAHVT